MKQFLFATKLIKRIVNKKRDYSIQKLVALVEKIKPSQDIRKLIVQKKISFYVKTCSLRKLRLNVAFLKDIV